MQHVCEKNGQKFIESFGYGKFEQPDEQGAYDRWEMKLSKQVAPLVKEWCDMLLFDNYKTYVVTTDNNAKKGQGGKRVIYTSHHPCWDAKNRHGLPAEMELDFKNLAHLFGAVAASSKPTPEPQTPTAERPIDKLRALMERDKISEKDIQAVAASRHQMPPDKPIDEYTDQFINGWVLKYWDQIKQTILLR